MKYKARPTIVDGIRFSSKKEASRYAELKLLERAGIIRELKLQPVFPFEYKGKRLFKYIADFSYQSEDGYIVEDVKGVKTAVYKLKKKLIEASYNLKILET